LASTPSAMGDVRNKIKPKPICRLEVQNAHISGTIKKLTQREVVKVNVSSICNVPQLHVLNKLEIHKKGEFGDHIYGPFENDQIPSMNSGFTVKLQNKFVECRSSTPTEWFGVASSRALINGSRQFAGRTQSPKVVTLPCGT